MISNWVIFESNIVFLESDQVALETKFVKIRCETVCLSSGIYRLCHLIQVVDMRWGVRDEATDDHMTTKLCITEIANCQRLSVGANFVVFLCQKYGYRPIPSEILSTELELLKRTLREEHEDISLLENWYIEDSNSVPSMFVLQPISSILVNFNNKVHNNEKIIDN